MAEAGLTAQSQATLKRDFALLALSKQDKEKIIKSSLQEIKKRAMKNKNRQQNPDGKPWQPRKKPKADSSGKPVKQQKMLRKIYGKAKVEASGASGKLYFRNMIERRIATEHHYGLVPQRTKSKE